MGTLVHAAAAFDFCCIITPNNFVLTELASQKRKEAIKNCI